MTREQILAWELSCNQRNQQESALSPEVGTVSLAGVCKKAGCPPAFLWEFLQQWKISNEIKRSETPKSLPNFRFCDSLSHIYCWLATHAQKPAPFRPRNASGLSRGRHQSTRASAQSQESWVGPSQISSLDQEGTSGFAPRMELTFSRCHSKTVQLLSRILATNRIFCNDKSILNGTV